MLIFFVLLDMRWFDMNWQDDWGQMLREYQPWWPQDLKNGNEMENNCQNQNTNWQKLGARCSHTHTVSFWLARWVNTGKRTFKLARREVKNVCGCIWTADWGVVRLISWNLDLLNWERKSQFSASPAETRSLQYSQQIAKPNKNCWPCPPFDEGERVVESLY